MASNIGNEYAEEISSYVSEEIPEITHEEMAQNINQEMVHNNDLFEECIKAIKDFIEYVDKYEHSRGSNGSLNSHIEKLKNQKEILYQKFFNIQNLINAYEGQVIVMTYVHIDESGRREIRISENNIEHLKITESEGWPGGPKFKKLSYVVDEDYRLLKQNIPKGAESNEQALQETAMEVNRRYMTYKKRVLWFYPAEWKGYKLTSLGPINEAFVDCYVHNVQLLNSLEGNIDAFMEGSHGAIQADATRGFMIGDISKGGVQYAVKGNFGSPQGYKEVLKSFKELQENGFSKSAFEAMIKRYTKDELEKNYKPQIKKLSMEGLKKGACGEIDRLVKKEVMNLKIATI